MITQSIQKAANELREGNLVAIPTETVYGLAANIFDEQAVQKIFTVKRRPLVNPLIVHVRSVYEIDRLAKDVPDVAYTLARETWPGPVTLVLPKKDVVPDIVTGGRPTVALRMPAHPLTLELLHHLDFPLAAPSANPFGTISPTKAKHVHNYFPFGMHILDGGDCERGIESTIIGFEEGQPVLYRPGAASVEVLEKIVGKMRYPPSAHKEILSPGMFPKHYSPATPMVLTHVVADAVALYPGKKIGVLSFTQNNIVPAVQKHIVLSQKGDINEAAKKLYTAMHELDGAILDIIIAERMPDTGIGRSMNDRLERAVHQ